MTKKPHQSLVEASEVWLAKHGDTPEGVGWKSDDADIRYRVMLEMIRESPSSCSLLDFGCGASHLLEYIRRKDVRGINYSGLDVSRPFIALSRAKFPDVVYYTTDLLGEHGGDLPDFDYIVMNGIFTYKAKLSHEEMFRYCRELIEAVFPHAKVAMAFNAITTRVDWAREDLFHLALDPLLDWLSRNVSRHVVVRHDYGLYEYTVYVYRDPNDETQREAKRLIS